MASIKEIAGHKLGKKVYEGKTKQVFELVDNPDMVLLLNKNRITAGNGVRAQDLEKKAEISNKTNSKVFEILNAAGIRTAFVKCVSKKAFLAKNCDMVPIEWVTRRVATGSYLKRNTDIKEGHRFAPPMQETFFKDDENHDSQWSEKQIVSAGFKVNGLVIGQDAVNIMRAKAILVFEILETAWETRNCALIDMKIEFGVDKTGQILVADVIDSDSWRLWPSGDKRLMVDNQDYRDLVEVTELDTVKRDYNWVSEQLDNILPKSKHLVVILMGSASDKEHCEKIAKHCQAFGLNTELRVSSAHKDPQGTLRIVQEYESLFKRLVVFICVAGRSNGLGPVVSGITNSSVINCPPLNAANMQMDIWSSLDVPSGLGCSTVLYPEQAALNAAHILGYRNYLIWSKSRVKMAENLLTVKKGDKESRGLRLVK